MHMVGPHNTGLKISRTNRQCEKKNPFNTVLHYMMYHFIKFMNGSLSFTFKQFVNLLKSVLVLQDQNKITPSKLHTTIRKKYLDM